VGIQIKFLKVHQNHESADAELAAKVGVGAHRVLLPGVEGTASIGCGCLGEAERPKVRMEDFTDFIAECDRAPRLNELAPFFSATAAGRSGMPWRRPDVDRRLLPRDPLVKRFIALHERRQGPFDQHYLSSIPYRFEEECRLGCAILRYASDRSDPISLYSLGTAEGTMARTISELADGLVETLSCSPNVENERSFFAHGTPPHASFFCGPFHHLTPSAFIESEALRHFQAGFDIIMEDTTFQMYSPNRKKQIAFVAQNLKPDGILLLVEKFRHGDDSEYKRREDQKDFGFKARYFSTVQILAKEEEVLTQMNENEVTLEEITAVLRDVFLECFVTWNSGNFYTLAASNSPNNLKRLVSKMGRPALPAEYTYSELPFRLYDRVRLASPRKPSDR
jgi:hypothetical protein